MAERALPKVRRSDVGGVPAFWADAPPPYELQLRVGRAHETLATSGSTHIVEDLAVVGELALVALGRGHDPPPTPF